MFFALANGLLDASIAVWDCKRASDYVRPISAIRFLFKDQRVYAWGGPNRGRQLITGEQWQPYQVTSFVTPPFAEYVSGHSTFSATSAEILKLHTGSDAFGLSAKIAAGSSKIEPNATPANDVTLSWATFTDAALEAGLSRLYGGIHFQDGNAEGQKMGRKIGGKVWLKAQSYFDGLSGGDMSAVPYAEDAILHRGIVQPGVTFLSKPFTVAELARRARELLDAAEGRRRDELEATEFRRLAPVS